MQPHTHAHLADARISDRRRLQATLALVSVYMVAEVVGGLAANSLALLADAGHMLTDAVALALALFALWAARRPATSRRTYGFYRLEILAALANGASLVAISLFIFVEAFRRLAHPPEVHGGLMLAVAAGGLAVNLASLWILRGGRTASLNVRGAWLHVLTDTLGSLQAIVAGAFVSEFGWRWADPLASLLIGVLVITSSWGLLRESLDVLLESVPGHLDPDAVRDAILRVEGVASVCDLHIWTITSGFVALSAHVVTASDDHAAVLRQVTRCLNERFAITHTTIQVEPADSHPRLADHPAAR